ELVEFDSDASPSQDTASEGSATPKSTLSASASWGRRGLKGRRAKNHIGLRVWSVHESSEKPLSVVPTTAMGLVETYVMTVARRFPADASVQAVILRAGASSLGTLRNTIAAHVDSAVEICPDSSWDLLLWFLSAVANDCWQLAADGLPSVEESYPQAMEEGAQESFETLKQLWMQLGVSCCRNIARAILGFMKADDLFSLGGMHEEGSEEAMQQIRKALEYYCGGFVGRWMHPYFYGKVLVRVCDHVVVKAAEGLRQAASRGEVLNQGQILRVEACREILAEALAACAGNNGDGAGLYNLRLGFLDTLLSLITTSPTELLDTFKSIQERHSSCQGSVPHALQAMIVLRGDGDMLPEELKTWADPLNWMGTDACERGPDYSEWEPFHRVFSVPLSSPEAPLGGPTVLDCPWGKGRVSTGTPLASNATAATPTPKSGGTKGGELNSIEGTPGGKRGGRLGSGAGIGTKIWGDGGAKVGLRLAKQKLGKMGLKGRFRWGISEAEQDGGAGVVAMGGKGHAGGTKGHADGTKVLRVVVVEAKRLRNIATIGKTDSYVVAEFTTRDAVRNERTSVRKNSVDPKWGETLLFPLPGGSMGSLVEAQLVLRVMGRNRVLDDVPLGLVTVPLAGYGENTLEVDSPVPQDGGSQVGVGLGGMEGLDGVVGRWFDIEGGQG
ncbi:unnamed protein product, partial [Discosporangium mesarthrocarpum]